MTAETMLREKLATCTRVVAMQGLIGVFGHVSAYDPGSKRVFLSPGMGSDRSTTKGEDVFVLDAGGKILEPGDGDVPIEWPIHTAIHAARPDVLAVAHLHSPYATLFAIADRPFQPVTLQGALFAEGIPFYRQVNLVKTAAQGGQLVQVMGDKRAVLMRGHGAVVGARDLEEVLFCALVLEDDACKTMQAATLGKVGTISLEECRAFDAESGLRRRAHRAWDYLAGLEARWDRQMSTGKIVLFP
ncbi:MAG: class II aldolase/adducin family protein [Candidatus Binatia bacterium]